MDSADAGRRRTQAWLGPPPAEPPARTLRWVPNPEPATYGGRVPGVVVGGRYRLLKPLDQTDRIESWEAVHVELHRPVTLEFLSGQAGVEDRLIEDARAVARVRHPHVIEYIDFGRDAHGVAYLVSERIVGHTLEQLIARRGPIPWARTIAIVRQLGEALFAAHQHGIVHADLRPANVVLLDTVEPGGAGPTSDFVKLVGFGVARASYSPTAMSPEQCRGEPLDPRSDIYSLGCLLCTMITGDPPFVGEPQLVAWQQQYEPPKSLRERAPRQFIPEELEWVVARCLAKPPEHRFASAAELVAAIAQLAQFAGRRGPAEAAPSESTVMGYANRPAPKSPRELSDGYAPVPVAAKPVVRPPPAPDSSVSTLAIVGATLLGVAAVFGFGFGMYSLVEYLIAEPDRPAVEAHEVAEAAPPEPSQPSLAAPQSPIATPPIASRAESTPSAATAATPTKPSKKPRPASADEASEPEPAPTPEPVPTPKPAPKPKDTKPSVDPDSKAKDKIDYDELLDPWG